MTSVLRKDNTLLFKINKMHFLITLLALIILEYSIYLIGSSMIDKTIKIILPIFLIVFFKNYKLSKDRIIILCLYILLFCCVFHFNKAGIIQWFKYILMFLIFPIVLLKFPTGKHIPKILINFLILLGTIFSIQVIFLFIVILFNIPIQSTIITIARYNNMPEVSYGILGYANAIQNPYPGILILRSQGWFLEPSTLASFLIYPILVSLGYYLSNKQKRYLFTAVLCIFGLLSTSSLAGFFGLLASLVILIIFKVVKKRGTRVLALALSGLIILLLFNFIIHNLNDLYTDPQGSTIKKIIARNPDGPSGNLFRENYKLSNYSRIIEETPFGIGLGHTLGTNEITSANALVFWVVAGGLPAFIIILLLYFRLIFSYCLPLLQQRYLPYACIAAAFIGITTHNLSYGNWMSPFYLFIVALMILCYDDFKLSSQNNIHRIR